MIKYVFAMEILMTSFVLLILILTAVRADCTEKTYNNSKECVPCPLHCKYCILNISDTICFSCDDGYSGKICSQQCANCKPGSKCIKDTGICLEACKDGLAGQYCNKACDSRCRSCIRNDAKKCTTCKNGNICELVCPEDCYLHDDCNTTCKHRCLHNCNEDISRTEVWPVAVTVLAILLVMSIIVPLVMFIYKRKRNRQHRPTLPSERYNVATEEIHLSGGGFQGAAKVSENSERFKVTSRTSKWQDNAGQLSGNMEPACHFVTKTAYTTLFENNSEHQYTRPITKIHHATEKSGEIKYENTRGVEHRSSGIASDYITPL